MSHVAYLYCGALGHFGEANRRCMKGKGDNEEVHADVAEDDEDLGYPKLQDDFCRMQ